MLDNVEVGHIQVAYLEQDMEEQDHHFGLLLHNVEDMVEEDMVEVDMQD
jgi:hypothetical protein